MSGLVLLVASRENMQSSIPRNKHEHNQTSDRLPLLSFQRDEGYESCLRLKEKERELDKHDIHSQWKSWSSSLFCLVYCL